jgi:hypothetical protein
MGRSDSGLGNLAHQHLNITKKDSMQRGALLNQSPEYRRWNSYGIATDLNSHFIQGRDGRDIVKQNRGARHTSQPTIPTSTGFPFRILAND